MVSFKMTILSFGGNRNVVQENKIAVLMGGEESRTVVQ